MSINFDLKADLRKKLGSAESRRIRKSGNIPAVIYDNGNNVQVSIPSKEFEVEYFKGNIFTTLINLSVNGKNQKVITNKIDLNPVTDRPSHVTFIKADSKVKAKVKVNFLNKDKSPGLKRGGFLHITARKIELLCPVDAIPTEITVDIGKMKVGEKIRSGDISLPEKISFVTKKDFNIASITGRGNKEETAETATTDNAEAAAPAEAGKEAK